MDSLVLNKLITAKVPNVNLIVVSPIEIDRAIQYQAAQNTLYHSVMAQCANISPQDMACVIFESNYGLGGSDIFCNDLYQRLRTTFNNASFITYSSTVGSLNLALQNSSKLLACYNVQICSNKIDYLSSFPENYHSRIILKDKLLVKINQLLEAAEEKENQRVPQLYVDMSIDSSDPRILTQFSTITSAATSSSFLTDDDQIVPVGEVEEESILENRTLNASPIPSSRRSPNTSKL
ncbi:hypothetical protein CC99x_007595 [Candidatus Berkiella cookevillensis]|nr:hypothetical protein [Candidatus Berkiella cookevillensis]MCS5708766.1 hypothetical protein [Candidatus Berkiella cookevillensis]